MGTLDKAQHVIDSIHGLVKAVPVYQDVLQPAAKVVGKDLETVAKAVSLVLAPVAGLVWGYETIKDYVLRSLAEKLRHVPKKNLVPPSPMVAGPTLEALKYAGHSPTLRELYANLLATSIDRRTAHEAHPAFVEIIRQLTPDEAKILKFIFEHMYLPIITLQAEIPGERAGFDYAPDFSNVAEKTHCQFPELTPQYLGNICRLGLAEFHRNSYIDDKGMYWELLKHKAVKAVKKEIREKFSLGTIVRREYVAITELGRQFCRACLLEKTNSEERVSRKKEEGGKR